jgi:hypothetical protein
MEKNNNYINIELKIKGKKKPSRQSDVNCHMIPRTKWLFMELLKIGSLFFSGNDIKIRLMHHSFIKPHKFQSLNNIPYLNLIPGYINRD